LDGSNIQGLKQRNLKLGEREPQVKGLYDNPIHQKIVGGIRINYGHEILSAHGLYNDVTLFPGTRKLDGSSKGLDTILGMVFGLGEHRCSGRIEEHQFLSCERRARDYYTVTIAIATTTAVRIAIALKNGKVKHFIEVLNLIKGSVPPNAMKIDLTLSGGAQRGNRRKTPFTILFADNNHR
jgi:hypothetical protein